MEALLLALLGVFGAGTLASIPAWVSTARLADVKEQLVNLTADRDKWREAAGTLQKAVDRQEQQDARTADRELLSSSILVGIREIIKETR